MAVSVALAFFASDIYSLYSRAGTAGAGIDSIQQIVRGQGLAPAIVWDLFRFVSGLLALHFCIALLGWLLSRSVYGALSNSVRMRPWHISGVTTFALFVWVYAANATLFPWSVSAGGMSGLASLGAGSVNLFAATTLVLGGLVAYAALLGIRSSRVFGRYGTRVFVYPVMLVVGFGTWRLTTSAHATDEATAGAPPHVIVIGIDSLRPDAIATGGAVSVTPRIDSFIAESIRFDDTVTPLARTFPSWITILSGRHPVATGARENLLAPEMLHVPSTIAHTLSRHGYRTVYATDEVRCSYIDRRYGFDEVVGPRMGALDFLLGTINDLPLPNLVANTPIGAGLFPYTHGNRAAAATYKLETFVEIVADAVEFDRPTFLAIHLTLPHFPYHWAAGDKDGLAATFQQPYLYTQSLAGVDRQVGMLLEMLDRKGALQNAIVVMLSDHGEAVGLPEDNLLYGREAKRNARGVTVSMWGHGNSTLSPSQYQVLFAWRGFGSAAGRVAAGRVQTSASLEDFAPTILDLLGIQSAQSFDGESLALEVSRGNRAPARLLDRVRFTETGIRVGFTKRGEAAVDDVVKHGVAAYKINQTNGRLELQPERYAQLMREKERAAIGKDWLLAAVPRENGLSAFVALPRAGGVPVFLEREPAPGEDPELSRLWRGLFSRFPGEIMAPQAGS